jgi:hypothetical protein
MVYTFGEANLSLGSFNSGDHNAFVWPIRYSYDYMPTNEASMPPFVDLTCFPDLEAEKISVEAAISAVHVGTEYSIKKSERLSMNSIPVFPVQAKLPWYSSIHHVRQNIHWPVAVEATQVLLQHFASDQTATSMLKEGGRSYAKIAAKELPTLHDNWTRFNAYSWPAASEKRMKLLAETLVYLFIFDGKWNRSRNITTLLTSGADAWEMNDESTVSRSKLLRLHIYNS